MSGTTCASAKRGIQTAYGHFVSICDMTGHAEDKHNDLYHIYPRFYGRVPERARLYELSTVCGT